jgi:hypothetical protein
MPEPTPVMTPRAQSIGMIIAGQQEPYPDRSDWGYSLHRDEPVPPARLILVIAVTGGEDDGTPISVS